MNARPPHHPTPAAEARQERWYEWHGTTIRVGADSPLTLAAIDEILGPYLCPPPSEGTPATLSARLTGPTPHSGPPADAVQRCRSEQLSFWWSDRLDEVWVDVHGRGWVHVVPREGRIEAALDLDPAEAGWLIAHHAFYPGLLELLKERGRFPLHAGLVDRGGSGLLLCGPSGSGKTTLTLALAGRGWKLLSDDTCFLRRNGEEVEALAFWEDLHVTDATVARFESLSFLQSQAPRRNNWKRHFAVRELPQLTLAESTRPRWLIFPSVAGQARTTLKPLHGVAPALRLTPQSVLPVRPAVVEQHVALVAQVANSVRAADLAMGTDLAEVVGVVEDFLARTD